MSSHYHQWYLTFHPLLIVSVCLTLISITAATVFSDSLDLCQVQCVDRNLVVPLARGEVDWDTSLFEISLTQRIDACNSGCQDLESANSTCLERCVKLTPTDSCMQGCRAVTDIFLHRLQDLLSHAQVAIGNDSSTGVNTVWSLSSDYGSVISDILVDDIQWAVQSRPAYASLSWNTTAFEEAFKGETLEAVVTVPSVFAEEIELRLCISWRTYTIVSAVHHLPIKDPGDVEPLPPTVTSHLQISVNSFVVCWKSTLKRLYKISLYSLDEAEISTALAEDTCYLFQEVPIDNCCRVEISYADNGTSSVSVRIDLINREERPESAAQLVFTNGTSIMRLYDIDDYATLSDLKLIPFELKPGRSITALSSVSAERLLIALDDGSIYWLAISGDDVVSGILRPPDGTAIVHMDVDHIQGAVYAVLFKKGILRCGLVDCQNTTILTTNTINYIEYISVDSWNGHIYCILNGGEVFSIPLFPLEAPHILPFSATERVPTAIAIAIEAQPENSRLISLTQTGSILALNIVNQSVTDLRINAEINEGYGNIKKAHLFDGRLFWISTSCGDTHSWDSCLYGEKYDVEKKKIQLNRYLYAGRVVDFLFLRDRPTPIAIPSPSKVGLITADSTARITWEPPILLPFQAQNAWRHLRYECRIIGGEGNGSTIAEFTQISGTSLLIPVSPGLRYHASVRACIDSTCSSYVNATNSAFAPFTEPLFIAFHQRINNNVSYYDMLGDPIEDYTQPAPVPTDETTTVFAYDRLMKSLYVAKTEENTIFRVRNDGSQQHFLDSVAVKFMTVMSRSALIVVASNYLIVSYRLTSTFDQEIYFCGSISGCGEVGGLAGDDETGDIFYLIRYPNGTTSLYALNQDIRTSYFIASSQNFPILRQLIVAKEKLVFITDMDEVGVCDKKLGALNFNLALKNVALSPALNFHPINSINFIGALATDDATARNTLKWSTEPTFLEGKIIFKIALYKEHWGRERFVDYSLSHSYTISDALLRQWPSKQKYDAEVEAVTAWDLISINQTGLIAPTKPPTPPINPTIYVTQQKTVDGARALMDLFWDEPREWNGEPLGYLINCTVDGLSEPIAEVPATTRFYSFSVKSGSVSCAVAAHNEPKLETFSQTVTIDSSELRPLVRLFATDSNNNVFSISNWSSLPQLSTRSKRQTPSLPSITEQSITYIGNDLYSIRKDSDSLQPSLLRLNPNNVENILHKVSIGGEIGKVDAMTSDWVANRLLFVSTARVMQLSLDAIQSTSIITPRSIMNLSSGAGDAKQLLFDPFSNTGFLLTKNGSLFALDLNMGVEENMALRLECLKSETVSWMMADFVWNLASLPAIYVLTWNGMIRVDLTSSKCEEIKFAWEKFGEKGPKSILSFAIADKLYIFVTSSMLVVYELSSSIATPIAINGSPPLKQILVATQSTQPFPERSCFVLPPASEIKFTVQNEERSGALISINEPELPNVCPGISLPPTQYEIHFQRRGSDKIRNIHSISNILHVENGILDKEADYDISVSWFNRYTPVSEASATQMLRTGYGFPSSPQEPAAFALTPDVVLLYWKLPAKPNSPIPEVKYMISQLSATQLSPSVIGAQQFEGVNYATTPTDVVSCQNDPCSAKISNLRPSTDYKFWVRAIHESHLNMQFVDDTEGNSVEASVRTKDIAGTLRIDNITGTSVVLRWNSLDPEYYPKRISIQYRILGMNAVWKSPYNASFEGSAKSVAVVVHALYSATTYDYRFAAEYVDSYRYANYDYSYNETFLQVPQQFRTKPGTPSAPASIRLVQEYDEWIVRWEKPLNDGGSPITSYALEFRPNEDVEWEIAERGLEGECLWWKPLKINFLAECAEFRIRAANSEGFGAYAYSKHHSGDSQTQSLWIIIITLLIAILLLTTVIAILFAYYQRNDRRRNEIRLQDISLNGYSNSIKRDILPSQIANDLKTIPRVPKNSISLLRIIGKGSFGEVYEGAVDGLPQSPSKAIQVAVKTLKSGFSESDRMKFLQEAVLMNSFDHPNIVKLLGVSLETEPYFLIIELMEGGDLLGFLRSSRPSDCLPSQLSLYELIGMMVDVGRGAAYLEIKKRVHRHLAARNCLISSRKSNTRITKIADFGHARDIYTNDYYRVHGDDFLPLRWLSPESIDDGIFTSKSDVWSFGILLWEILTLGQQPFSGKNNVQVMSFVKNGGKPEKPQFCPDEIFAIVERAWIYDPEERPRFADLLPELEALRGCPLYQEDAPYPPSCSSLKTDSNFELSFNSNISHGESARSESVRFDKSDNPSTKKQGRPSILRSLRRERPKPPQPSPADLETNGNRRSKSVNSTTSDVDSFTRDCDEEFGSNTFMSSGCYEIPKKSQPMKSQKTRPKHRVPESSNRSPISSSSASPYSSLRSPSSGDSDIPSIYIRPARVSRV